jgi:hypothetical protein
MEQFKPNERRTPSQETALKANPPAYLTATTVCMRQLPLAIAISCLSFIILCMIIINSANLIFQTETSHLLSLILALFFLLSCTAAIWKHTLKS